uniref:NSP1-1 n=1 Tax=Rotavirus I TaxID=1637496 RepID=A0A1S6XXJ8_9REOV|nr:NSP1-1 [Rotavirus I]
MGGRISQQLSQQNTYHIASGNSQIYSQDQKTNQQVAVAFEVCHLSILFIIALALVVHVTCSARKRGCAVKSFEKPFLTNV